MKKHRKWTMLASICSIAMLAGMSSASAHPAQAVTAVTYIDVIPDQFVAGNEEKARALLKSLNAEVGQEPGLVSFAILQEVERPNHFTFLETWSSESAFDAHEQSAHKREFRKALQPLIGSPYQTLVTTRMN